MNVFTLGGRYKDVCISIPRFWIIFPKRSKTPVGAQRRRGGWTSGRILARAGGRSRVGSSSGCAALASPSSATATDEAALLNGRGSPWLRAGVFQEPNCLGTLSSRSSLFPVASQLCSGGSGRPRPRGLNTGLAQTLFTHTVIRGPLALAPSCPEKL